MAEGTVCREELLESSGPEMRVASPELSSFTVISLSLQERSGWQLLTSLLSL